MYNKSWHSIDVYKRQIDNAKDDIAVRRIINVPKRGIGLTSVNRVQAVSYTHLDVYKRQRQHWQNRHYLQRRRRNKETYRDSGSEIGPLFLFVSRRVKVLAC